MKSLMIKRFVDRIYKGNYKRLKKAICNNNLIIGRYPLNVQIQTVSACNGKCEFCPYRGSWHEANSGKMSWEIYEKIVLNLKKYKIRKFCLYLENEPLLDNELFKKVEFASKLLNPQIMEISTNLSILTAKMLERIRDLFSRIPHEIWISFHGVSKESYEQIMGINYEESLNNVLRLVELAQQIPLNIVIRGSGAARLSGYGLKEYFKREEYHRFWKEKLSGFRNKPRIFYFRYHDRAGSVQLKKKGMSFNAVERKDLCGFYCVRFDRWLHFLYTGEPILCCMDYNKETGFGASVKDLTIEELFSSEQYNELIKKGIGMMESEEGFICKRCICPGG